MTQRVEIPTLISYCDLDTVIDELTRLRDQYNGRCMVDLSLETDPYDDYPHIEATLEIPE